MAYIEKNIPPKNLGPSVMQPSTQVTVDGITYEQIPIKSPRLIWFGEDLHTILQEYVQPHYKEGDWITLSEKLVSLSQNLMRHVSDVHVTLFARFITLGVKKHKTMIAWSRPEKMQVVLDIVGYPRMVLAMILGSVGKLFGIRGIFWIVAGHRVSEIDGFISDDMYPYTEWIILPPPNPQEVCDTVEQSLGMPMVLADANFLDVKVLGVSKGVELNKSTVRRILLNNPLGQGDTMTPFVIIRRVNTNN